MLIKLDSAVTSQPAHDFEVSFTNFTLNRNKNYECALVNSQFFYSFFNISAEFGNNNLRYGYSVGGGNFVNVDITFEDGIYSISQINDKLASSLKSNNFFTTINGIETFPIVLSPNFSTLKVDCKINNSLITNTVFRVSFNTTNSLRKLLGFDSIEITADGTTSGENPADITKGTTSLSIHASLITGSYENSSSSDVIFSSSPSTASVGGLIEFKPNNLIYLPINQKNEISQIRMRLTNQVNEPIKLNDPTGITYLLHIREKN